MVLDILPSGRTAKRRVSDLADPTDWFDSRVAPGNQRLVNNRGVSFGEIHALNHVSYLQSENAIDDFCILSGVLCIALSRPLSGIFFCCAFTHIGMIHA